MNITLKAGIASAVAVAACFVLPTGATAADLNGGYGSMKDSGYQPMPHVSGPALAGPCYMRGDIGYSWNSDPKGTYVGNATDPNVRHSSIDGGGVYEVGIGCGSGSRGLRGDVTFGYRPDRDFKGDVDIVIAAVPVDPPIKTTLDTYTVMFNGYYDFGKFRGFVPYVGAGIGMAVHDMGYVTIDHPGSPNAQHGDTKVDLAWALMAGVGYQLTSNAVLDFGYRYIDLGSAQSGTQDVANFNNPKLVIDDIHAHEIKIGLRYHFGASAEPAYAPMK